MKNKTFFDSIKCAASGLVYAVRTEKNFRWYFVIALFFLILNIVFRTDATGFLFFILTTVGVFASECINTALEHLADFQTTEIKPELKLVKDIAAAMVLCWGIGFFLCEIIILVKGVAECF